MPGPRKPETIRLHPARRQVFQWHIREDLPLQVLKQKMDQLSLDLFKITGQSFIASESAWEGRISYWNRRSPGRWNIKKRQRGPDVLIPTDIVDVPYWRAWDLDVGDWAKWEYSEPSKHNLLNTPSRVVSDVDSNPNESPILKPSFWKAREGQGWGLSNSGESGISRVPSLFSGSSRSTVSLFDQSLSTHSYSQDPETDDARTPSLPYTMSTSWMYIYPPQLPHPGNANNHNVSSGKSLFPVLPAEAPGIYQADYSYEGCQNLGYRRIMQTCPTTARIAMALASEALYKKTNAYLVCQQSKRMAPNSL